MKSEQPLAEYSAIRRAIIDDRLDEAEAMIDALLAKNGEDAEAFMLAGKVAAARRDAAGELEMTREAVNRDPDNGEYHALLARCYAKAQQFEAGMASLSEALARPPLTDLALDALAGTLAQFGRHREAAELLTRAVDEGTR